MLLRPRWLIGHLLVVAVAGAFLALGFWQLDRHRETQDAQRAEVAAAAASAPDLVALGADAVSGTRVTVRGAYDAGSTTLLRNRVREGRSGYDVLTALRLSDGTGVVVDRGWVARSALDAEVAGAVVLPPTEEVTVRGTLLASRELRADDTVETVAGLDALPRVDVGHLADGLDYPLRDLWLTAQWQDPEPVAGGPALPEPARGARVNHLSYAAQWFGLAAVPLVGWPLVLWQRVRRARP